MPDHDAEIDATSVAALAGCAPQDPFSTHITADGTTTIIATGSQDASITESLVSATGPLPESTLGAFASLMIIVLL